MKDIIVFPVVGSQYTTGNLIIKDIPVGAVLLLEHEPDNLFDKNAIKVMVGEQHIGYLPNKGTSCSQCWHHIGPQDTWCPSCGASWDYAVEGGLATRLIMTDSLKHPYGCFVQEIKATKAYSLIAKLILE